LLVPRYDYAAHLVIGERLDAPTPAQSTAIRTPEGYLIADAYLARDGLLRYSDGARTWVEYRPRAELERLAGQGSHCPVTDDHPELMVTADTWREAARGHLLSAPTVEVVDGVAYLRGRVLVADAELIKEIDGGKNQLSFGFRTLVVPAPNGVAPDGTRCDAVQTDLELNHYAVVDRGRAGPEVKLLMDGSAWLVPMELHMKTKQAETASKKDELGAPVDAVEYMAPDGTPIMLPTWVVAQLEQAKAAMAPAPPAAPAAPADAPEEPKPAPAPAPAPPAPTPEPPRAGAGNPAPDDEEKDKKDSLRELVRRRSRLERLAASAGIDKFDAEDDELSREYIAKRMPTVKTDGMSPEQLAALVEAAASLPTEKPAAASPWSLPTPAVKADAIDEDAAVIEYLKGQGY
jgi:hypothetical protein